MKNTNGQNSIYDITISRAKQLATTHEGESDWDLWTDMEAKNGDSRDMETVCKDNSSVA